MQSPAISQRDFQRNACDMICDDCRHFDRLVTPEKTRARFRARVAGIFSSVTGGTSVSDATCDNKTVNALVTMKP
jgi:hypothetical protein